MENKNELAFEKCGVIQELNKVEGFNPLDYVTSSKNDRGEDYINLDTKYRQLWFRLCYPHGKVTKKFLRLTDQVAAVEARVYLDRNDPEEYYVASGVAQRFYDANKDFGLYYLESAETIAEGRALGKAGFGIQFCDFDGQKDDVMPDTGIKVPNGNGAALGKHFDKPQDKAEKETAKTKPSAGQVKTTKKTVQHMEAASGSSVDLPYDVTDDIQPDTQNNSDQTDRIDTPAEQVTGAARQADNAQNEAAAVLQFEQQGIQDEPSSKATDTYTDNGGGGYDANTPVEEILKVMTVEEAESVAITVGFNRGKTLRQVALANFRQLRWFFESYNGDNNVLKAGARLLFERSQGQQQKAS